MPTAAGNIVNATFEPTFESKADLQAGVDVTLLRFMYEGEPECVLYNGVGGPDNATAVAAWPFFVHLGAAGAAPAPVPAPPCAKMLVNGACYFAPEPCNGYHSNVSGAPNSCTGKVLEHCCWDPITNKGQCEPKGSAGCKNAR